MERVCVKAGTPSDPYLIAFYDQKSMQLKHDSKETVTFTVEVDPTGNGDWMEYKEFSVKPEETVKYDFPATFEARWIRFTTNKNTNATAWLEYR